MVDQIDDGIISLPIVEAMLLLTTMSVEGSFPFEGPCSWKRSSIAR
jgi:hypothetical protein